RNDENPQELDKCKMSVQAFYFRKEKPKGYMKSSPMEQPIMNKNR
ncbi:6499_t:CDS:1, partial [Scutellospora calospora]